MYRTLSGATTSDTQSIDQLTIYFAFSFIKQTLTPPKTGTQPVVPVYNCVLMRTMIAVALVTVGGEGDGEVGDV